MSESVFVPPFAPSAVEVALARTPNTVPLARHLAKEWMKHWDAPAHIREASELIASELVTNSVAHARGPRIRLRIRWAGARGGVEVWDASAVPLPSKRQGAMDLGGRGLPLVAAYATCWGYYFSGGGKVVWAELTLGKIS